MSMILNGNEKKAPLIIGNTSNDSSVAIKDFGFDQIKLLQDLRAKGIYLGPLFPSGLTDAELGRQVIRDLLFTLLTRQFADKHSKVSDCYRYYFDYVAEQFQPRTPDGVAHGLEIPYFFGTGDHTPPYEGLFSDADRQLSTKVIDYLISFASTGTPSSTGNPTWTKHDTKPLLLKVDASLTFAEKLQLVSNFQKERQNAFILGGGLRLFNSISM